MGAGADPGGGSCGGQDPPPPSIGGPQTYRKCGNIISMCISIYVGIPLSEILHRPPPCIDVLIPDYLLLV